MKISLFIGLFPFLQNTLLFAQTPVEVVGSRLTTFYVDAQYLSVPYFSNRIPDSTYSAVERAVVVIHGTNRNAADYYRRILNPARRGGNIVERTTIIAPQFLREIDIETHHLPDNMPFWSNNGWKRGDRSLDTMAHPRLPRISSFAVIDTILYRLASANPQLQIIVLAGHSAGGQFVNRYAASNRIEQLLNAEFGIQLRYIVANPSSYLYFSESRRVVGTLDKFVIPSQTQIQNCPTYNDYKYGLVKLNRYVSAIGTAKLTEQYQQRQLAYLLGAEDNNPNSTSMDTSCEAMLQGVHRLERGRVYFNYLQYEFGTEIKSLHKQAIVPNVGHSSEDIFASECGMFFLFDFGNCDSITSIKAESSFKPDRFILHGNYPNPFNPGTTIQFSVSEKTALYLEIYDLSGRTVRVLSKGDIWNGGTHSIDWNGRDDLGGAVTSGIYFYKLRMESAQQIGRMLLIK